jgi:sigma-B regulation protein RsbU (phosphoserine phosphatase)
LLTSKSEKNDIARGLDAGADDFLTKPINAPELRARISAGERILRMERELTEKNRLVESTLNELQSLYDSLDNDLIEAKKLQQSLLRDRYHDFGFAEISLMLKSSGHVGGDLVGMFPVNDRRVFLYGIDVSGHGISSALMTARLAGYLTASARDQNLAFQRTFAGTYIPRRPAETIGLLNQLVLNEMDTEHYFTMLLADVSLDTGRVLMCQAGHPYPALQRATGEVEMIGEGGMPVGLVDGASYSNFEIYMTPGERLLVHSDGIVECANLSGELLGDEGFADMLRSLKQTKGMALA